MHKMLSTGSARVWLSSSFPFFSVLELASSMLMVNKRPFSFSFWKIMVSYLSSSIPYFAFLYLPCPLTRKVAEVMPYCFPPFASFFFLLVMNSADFLKCLYGVNIQNISIFFFIFIFWFIFKLNLMGQHWSLGSYRFQVYISDTM